MFQQVYQTLGQNEPNSNYPLKTAMKCFVENFNKEKYDTDTGKLKSQKLYLKAENNEIAEVYLKGNFIPLTNLDKGKWYDFLVWPFKPQNSTKVFLCCWIQNQQSAPQNAPQSTNSNDTVDLLTDIYGVLCKVLVILEKETDFKEKYNLGESQKNTQVQDDSDMTW